MSRSGLSRDQRKAINNLMWEMADARQRLGRVLDTTAQRSRNPNDRFKCRRILQTSIRVGLNAERLRSPWTFGIS